MKIFMLGWEFPPFISGGLGTACYGLTRALNQLGHEIVFVLPQNVDGSDAQHVRLKTHPSGTTASATGPESPTYQTLQVEGLDRVELRAIPSSLRPYGRPEDYEKGVRFDVVPEDIQGHLVRLVENARDDLKSAARQVLASDTSVKPDPDGGKSGHYDGDMFGEVHRYAKIAMQMALDESFDVIHAHDWMTYPAGIAVAAITGKPLVIHVHSTEFDRTGEHVNQRIYDIERQGMQSAHRVICVSHLTRNIVLSRYGAASDKVEVVYNAIDQNGESRVLPAPIRRDEKIVLFLGRITLQKGPEYFLAAAKKVLDHGKNVRFIMAGSGDMIRKSIDMATRIGIGDKVLFTGFLRGDDVARVYKMADLYVMPSVSEPFGIAPLEALSHDVPALISKQSGVSEILKHVLKVDFWDIDEMANKIIAVLRHPPLQATLREHGNFEIRRLTWRDSARGCLGVYGRAISVRN